VLKGVPFRDAYKQVGLAIEKGEFKADQNSLNHTHEGSIGNLCLPEIKSKMSNISQGFNFEQIDKSILNLLKN